MPLSFQLSGSRLRLADTSPQSVNALPEGLLASATRAGVGNPWTGMTVHAQALDPLGSAFETTPALGSVTWTPPSATPS